MTDIHALHHTGLTVSSLERSVAFYRDVLGFEVLAEQEKEGGYLADIVGYPGAHVRMAVLRLQGSEHRLELFEYLHPRAESAPHEPRLVGPTHVCMVVDDLPSVHARLEAAGVEFFSPPVLVDTGINTGGFGVYLRDPDGIILELFQPPAR